MSDATQPSWFSPRTLRWALVVSLALNVLIIGAQAEYGCPISGAVITDQGGTANASQKVRWTDPALIWKLNEIGFAGGVLSVHAEASWSMPPATSSLSIVHFVIYFYDPVYYGG